MAEELVDQKIEVTVQEMANAMYTAWCRYFGAPPGRNSVLVLLAQWALETGNGKSMHNYNVGNVKANPSGPYDYQYFACNEKVSLKAANQYVANAAPGTAKITRDNGDGTCWIWFYPKHVGCCFRAFKTLEDGVFDHLALLVNHRTFKNAWPAVVVGSPEQFSKLLRQAGYYTADEASYTRGVVRLFNQFGSVVTLPEPPVITSDLAREVRNTIATSLQNIVAAGEHVFRGEPEDEPNA